MKKVFLASILFVSVHSVSAMQPAPPPATDSERKQVTIEHLRSNPTKVAALPEASQPTLPRDPDIRQQMQTFLARLQEQDETEFAEETGQRLREFLSQPQRLTLQRPDSMPPAVQQPDGHPQKSRDCQS